MLYWTKNLTPKKGISGSKLNLIRKKNLRQFWGLNPGPHALKSNTFPHNQRGHLIHLENFVINELKN